MMEYLIRLVQIHETFRRPELEALAGLAGVEIEWVEYSEDSPFAIIRFPHAPSPDAAARALIKRCILAHGIWELWGLAPTISLLHQDITLRTSHLWPRFSPQTFRFEFGSYQGSRSPLEQRSIIESLSFMGFTGRIRMKSPDNQFHIFEEYALDAKLPHRILLGRHVADSGRKAMNTYSLKKRRYISTTSMDAELSLVTANFALARPGALVYDPFMGTGSFPVSCAHFGACVFGSDLDGRSIRGSKARNVASNFAQYGTEAEYLGGLVADLTNSPLRRMQCLDAIVCDPPYGVREGLKVLGSTRVALREIVYLADGSPAHLQKGYVPPKKAYSFLRMLDDVLDFGSEMLVEGGRLCMWMPVAGAAAAEAEGDEGESEDGAPALVEAEYEVPAHPALRLVSLCTQDFSKWSRRLLTYERLEKGKIDEVALLEYKARRLALIGNEDIPVKARVDELNGFRKRYFEGFR